MTKEKLDWTHKKVNISDIRKIEDIYIMQILISYKQGDRFFNKTLEPLFIKDVIFEERLKSYFLKDISNISRDEILNVSWNMYITQGYYIKIDKYGEINRHNLDPNRWYISYLEISGPLGTFKSVYNKRLET